MRKFKLFSAILLFALFFNFPACSKSYSDNPPIGNGPITAPVTTAYEEFFTDEKTGRKFLTTHIYVDLVQPFQSEKLTTKDFAFVGCKKAKLVRDFDKLDENHDQVFDDDGNLVWIYRYLLELDTASPENIKRVEALLSNLENFDSVHYYNGVELCMTPNDYSITTNGQWAINKINLPETWDIKTNSTVRIGIIDTGLDISHEDIGENADPDDSTDFTGYAYYADTDSHGTWVAGVIAAKGNNNIGITGVCWDANITSLRVADEFGIQHEKIIDAIEYAQEIGIDILNISLSVNSSAGDEYISELKNAIENFDGLVICAAGNNCINLDNTPYYPAAFNLSNLITVGSIRETGFPIADDSNYSKVLVDIFAPGVNIKTCNSTYPTIDSYGKYFNVSGTSFAAPYVSGVAALILSKYPNMSVCDLKATILENAQNIYYNNENALYNYCRSGGCLDAYAAINNPVSSHQCTIIKAHTGDYEKHTLMCKGCTSTEYENHVWEEAYINPDTSSVRLVRGYKCFGCGATSIFNPNLQ